MNAATTALQTALPAAQHLSLALHAAAPHEVWGPLMGAPRAVTVVLAQADSVEAVLTNIRNWIMGIAAAVATVFLSIGAIRYMAASGDMAEVEKAKVALRSAALGYGVALLAPLVVSVLRQIAGA